jgi:hypothetical protein
MDSPTIRLDQTVQEVLSAWPETQRAFRALKTSCIGCYLARFCFLQDVAEAYRIPAGDLLDEMDKTVRESQTQTRSAQ